MSTTPTQQKFKCGSYGELKKPSEDSKNVLKNVFETLTKLHEDFHDLDLNTLLDNHNYTTQVVAGLNYRFNFFHKGANYNVKVWAKLDKTFETVFENKNKS